MNKSYIFNKSQETVGHGKILKKGVATLALTTATFGVGANLVHAEEATPVSDTVVTTQVTEVTPADVTKAENDLNLANQSVSDQTEVVTEAQKDLTTAQGNLNQAEQDVTEAQVIKDQATPEAISEQKTAISDATQDVSETEALIVSDKGAIEAKEVDITNQEAVVSQAQSDVADKESELTLAKEQEKQAQAILDGTGAQELYNQQEALETKVAKDKTTVSTAETNLAKAQAEDKNLAAAIDTKTNEVSAKTNEVSANKLTLDQATQTYNNATSNYNTAQSELSKAQADVDSVNQIVVSQEYVNTLKAFVTSYDNDVVRADLKAKLDQLSTALLAQNVFKSNPYDKQVIINDPNNLTKAQIEELSLFGADLQNQIRSYFGTIPVVVTPDSVDMTDLVTDGYVADNWGWDSVLKYRHNTDALRNAAANEDIGFTKKISENLNTLAQETGKTTMDYLKSLVYMAYTDFMYADSLAGYGHAESISGLSEVSRATKTYIGIDISSVAGATSVHVNDISDGRFIIENSNFDTTEIPSPYDTEALKATLATKQRTFNTAQTAYNNAKTNLTNAQTAYNNSKATLATLVKELETLKATPLKTPAAQTALTSAKNTLAKDQAALKAVNDSIATLEADITVKKANLDKAKAVVADKEAALKAAEATLATEQSTLNRLNAELSALKAQLAEDEAILAKAKAALAEEVAKLALLENADENLAKALANLEEAKSLLDVAKITLSTETETLEALKAQQAQAQTTYDTVLTAYQAQELAKLEAKRHAIIESGQAALPIYNDQGELIDYVAQNQTQSLPTSASLVGHSTGNATFSLLSNTPSTRASKDSVSAEVLPQTGESQSILLLVGMGMMTAAYFAYGKKKEEEN